MRNYNPWKTKFEFSPSLSLSLRLSLSLFMSLCLSACLGVRVCICLCTSVSNSKHWFTTSFGGSCWKVKLGVYVCHSVCLSSLSSSLSIVSYALLQVLDRICMTTNCHLFHLISLSMQEWNLSTGFRTPFRRTHRQCPNSPCGDRTRTPQEHHSLHSMFYLCG